MVSGLTASCNIKQVSYFIFSISNPFPGQDNRHFTVMDGSEVGGDRVLIQTFLLYYVNKVVLMLINIFKGNFPYQSKVGLYQNKVNLSLTFTRRLGYYACNCKMVYWTNLTILF